MCENITKKNLDNNKIKEIREKIKINNDNPKLFIESIYLNNNCKVNIIQDGVLITGTKQRVVTLFIKHLLKNNKTIKTLLYAGTSNGFGAVAIAYGAYKLGLKSEIFISGKNEYNSRQITTMQALNANITLCPTFREARDLEYKYKKNGSYICPMGLNDEQGIMINLLSMQIKEALKNTILDNKKQPRIWLVSGSGGIAMSILKAIPTAHLFVLQTGGERYKQIVYEWSKDKENVTLIQNEELIKYDRDDRKLYYSSVTNYDDLIFPYVKKYAQNDDFIWNVASEDFI